MTGATLKEADASALAVPGSSAAPLEDSAVEWRRRSANLIARRARYLRAGHPVPARQRLAQLVDPDSFREQGLLAHEAGGDDADPAAPADAVITGLGRIEEIEVAIAVDDGSAFGGSRSPHGTAKVRRLQSRALAQRLPYVALLEGSAGRLPQMLEAGIAGGEGFAAFHALSRRVPTAAAIVGKAFGGPAFQAALSHFVVQVEGSGFLGVSGPAVVRGGTSAKVSLEEVGGSALHARHTGLVDLVVRDEREAITALRRFVDLAGRPWRETGDPPERGIESIVELVPTRATQGYDMRKVLGLLVDGGALFEFKAQFGTSVITALARIGGHAVGLVANQPKVLSGCVDVAATRKITRFIRTCDRIGAPLAYIQDVPGFLVGRHVEEAGQLGSTAELIAATLEASVPRVCVVLRKGYGMAYLVLGAHGLGGDTVFAWPGAELGLMGAEAAARVSAGAAATARRIEAETARYRALTDAYAVAGRAQIDDVIAPAETRLALFHALERFARRCPAAEREGAGDHR